MPTFIDESGDTGSVSNGGKPYFRLAAVWVPSTDDAQKFRENVRGLRTKLGLRTNYEFKFAGTHSHHDWRRAFLQTALKTEFKFAVCSVNKTLGEWQMATGSDQHNVCAMVLSAYLRPIYRLAEMRFGHRFRESVIVDDNQDKDFIDIITLLSRSADGKSTQINN